MASKKLLGKLSPKSFKQVRKLIESDPLGMRGKSLLSVADLTGDQISLIMAVSVAMKAAHYEDSVLWWYPYPRSVALLFEKPSLRTRVTFDLGIQQMGGIAIPLGPAEIGLGKRESAGDCARNLERLVDAIVARVFSHASLIELRDSCHVPVINGLSDQEHPCQALADMFTILEEFGDLSRVKLAWLGDGNNMLHSLLLAGALTGMRVSAACPDGFMPDARVVNRAKQIANKPRTITVNTNVAAALKDADVVYTDVWTSMGQKESERGRLEVFPPYQVNSAAMEAARPGALFMHCLPAHRGQEVSDDVIDGPQSIVFRQAENRLYVQKAILALIMQP